MPTPRRVLPVFLVALSLAALPAVAQAAPARTSVRSDRAELSLTRVSGIVNSLWSSLTNLWGRAGDSGTPGSSRPGDTGVSIDPNGLTGDNGGMIDPNGLAGDNGMMIDPNG